ncbi:hypothetical protein PENSPDRAFT_48095 [Peniophora sp. CONT]|nr:hypothetical protein PENSPDRAFT_48095 [Peniophora sp. CONT]
MLARFKTSTGMVVIRVQKCFPGFPRLSSFSTSIQFFSHHPPALSYPSIQLLNLIPYPAMVEFMDFTRTFVVHHPSSFSAARPGPPASAAPRRESRRVGQVALPPPTTTAISLRCRPDLGAME